MINNNNPDLTIILQDFEKIIFSRLNCVKIGKIKNFYPSDKTADVEICNKKTLEDGTIKDYPLLLKCLVVGNKITTPIETNENVVVLFNDFNLDSWFDTGNTNIPYNNRKHSLSDGIVICGLNNLNNAINYDNDNICLKYESEIKVGEDIKLTTENNLNLDSKKTEISSEQIDIKTISGGNINLDNTGFIKIANTQQSLYTILSTLLNALLSLRTGTDPMSANYVLDQNTTQAISTAITNLSLLLKA